jgi:hypothetical protein
MFQAIHQCEDFDFATIGGVPHYRTWDDEMCDFNDWTPLFG